MIGVVTRAITIVSVRVTPEGRRKASACDAYRDEIAFAVRPWSVDNARDDCSSLTCGDDGSETTRRSCCIGSVPRFFPSASSLRELPFARWSNDGKAVAIRTFHGRNSEGTYMKPAWTLVAILSLALVLGTSLLGAQQGEKANPPQASSDEANNLQGDEITLILRRLPPVIDDLLARDGLERLPPVESDSCGGLVRLPAATDELPMSEVELAGYDYPRTTNFESDEGSHEERSVERLPTVEE